MVRSGRNRQILKDCLFTSVVLGTVVLSLNFGSTGIQADSDVDASEVTNQPAINSSSTSSEDSSSISINESSDTNSNSGDISEQETSDTSSSLVSSSSSTQSVASENNGSLSNASAATEDGTSTESLFSQSTTGTKNGLVTENGMTYYYINGIKQVGQQTINGNEYYFDTVTEQMKTDYFLNNGNAVYYFGQDGIKYINQFYQNWGNMYYFGENDGARYTDQFYNNWGNTYYFGDDGARYTDQFYNNWGNTYYFGDDGARYTDQFYSNWGNTYYFGDDGARYTGQFYNNWGNTYYFDQNGVLAVDRFYNNWGNTYYFGNDGALYTNRFYHNWNSLYYFGDGGVLLKNGSVYYNSVGFFANYQGVLTLANSINAYIINNGLQPAAIQTDIWGCYPTDDMVYENGTPEGVVVHETATYNDSISGEINYAEGDWQNAFVHTYVSDSQIINVADTDLKCWGSGPAGNKKFVQFEQIEVHNKYAFASELNNAAYYTAYILKEYGLTPSLASSNGSGTIWSHHDVTGYLGGTDHIDPDGYWYTNAESFFGTNYTMATFLPLVEYYFLGM